MAGGAVRRLFKNRFAPLSVTMLLHILHKRNFKTFLYENNNNNNNSKRQSPVRPLIFVGSTLQNVALVKAQSFFSAVLDKKSFQITLFLLVERTGNLKLLGLTQFSKTVCLLVSWLLNVPATCECISGTDLLRKFYELPQ